MSAEDLIKMDVKRILNGEKNDEQKTPYNSAITSGLQKAIKKITDSASYTTKVVLLGNSKAFTDGQLRRLVEGYPVDQFSHARIYSELLFPVINGTYFTDPDLRIQINLANVRGGDSHLAYEVKAHSLQSNIKLLFVPTSEIGRIMHKYKNSILKFNPRSFLELRNNAVNKQIEASIKECDNNEFALFNNGITIISDETVVSSNTAKRGTAQIILRNPQLVNGGQTAYTLSRIYEQCKHGDVSVFRGKEVLLRVITFMGAPKRAQENARLRLISDISRASNSQTKIDESDRRSNDDIQVRLQRSFFDRFGLYFERKRGEFSDGINSGYLHADLLIKRERLIRVILAGEYRVNQARSNVAQFFQPDALESLVKIGDVDKYAYGHEILRLLLAERRKKPSFKSDRYHTRKFGQALRYGQYAVVAVCMNRGFEARHSETNAMQKVLQQWPSFEIWAQRRRSNAAYREKDGFDFVNYYKGATVNSDLLKYDFVLGKSDMRRQ